MATVFNKIARADVDKFKAYLEKAKERNALDWYQEIAGQSAHYPGQGSIVGLAYVALKMNGEAGEFAEHVGKSMRDDGVMDLETKEFDDRMFITMRDLSPSRRDSLIKEIGDELWYLQAACRELGISLGDAALANLEKLCDRGERGKLAGSGDNR